MHFDGMFSETAPIRIDPNRFDMIIDISTPIIGIIPYSIT